MFSQFLSLFPGEIRASENSYFCQAARQLASVPSSQLCVRLASGGDPTYAFNIRFTGEEVHGTSEWQPPARPIQPVWVEADLECKCPVVIFSLNCPRFPPLAESKPHRPPLLY